jgi:hypothetical protein
MKNLILSNYEKQNINWSTQNTYLIYQKKADLPTKLVNGYNENNSIVLAIKLMIRYDKPLTTSEISYQYK